MISFGLEFQCVYSRGCKRIFSKWIRLVSSLVLLRLLRPFLRWSGACLSFHQVTECVPNKGGVEDFGCGLISCLDDEVN